MVHWSRNRKQRIRLGYKDGIRVAFMKTPSRRNRCIGKAVREGAPYTGRAAVQAAFEKAAKSCK